ADVVDAGAITERVEALAAEKRRKEWEADLWVLNPEGDWSALASLKTLHEVPLPSEFEKRRLQEAVHDHPPAKLSACRRAPRAIAEGGQIILGVHTALRVAAAARAGVPALTGLLLDAASVPA
ncbi:hypothetical protein CYMTET_33605, partial [Cymbomonas tetramitiformis]